MSDEPQRTFRTYGTSRVTVDLTPADVAHVIQQEIARLLAIKSQSVVHQLVTDGADGVIFPPSQTRWNNPRAAALVDAMNFFLSGDVKRLATV